VALRGLGGPRLRRAARSRTGLVLAALALYLGAGAASTWPALRETDESFLAEGRAGRGEAAPGDHLQAAYQLWLPGHQLSRGAAPWRDPYSFQPLVEPRTTFAGWPFAIVFGPLHALLGTVGAWNLLVLLSYAGAGLAAFAWLRALEVPTAAALAGGLVFALAPYRAAQLAAGHMLAVVAVLLPLALWALERRFAILAAVALASIPLSGQVHLALAAIPFFVLYAALRWPGWRAGAGLAAPAVAAGLLVWAVSIRGSLGARDRSFEQVERYSADLGDFVSREATNGIERFVLLGWLTPLVALAGLVLVARSRPRLAIVLGVGALVPAVAALGAHLPGYEQLWEAVPGLHETRVPGRLLPIACLCLGALAAFALARLPTAVALVALALFAVDLRGGVELFEPTAADPGNRAYAARPRETSLLELPVFLPDAQNGSVYQYYALQAPGPRYGGYSTIAPPAADGRLRDLKPFECGGATVDARVQAVIVHAGLYRGRPDCLTRLLAALTAVGYREEVRDGEVVLYRLLARDR
jgi:hypothetical protein